MPSFFMSGQSKLYLLRLHISGQLRALLFGFVNFGLYYNGMCTSRKIVNSDLCYLSQLTSYRYESSYDIRQPLCGFM